MAHCIRTKFSYVLLVAAALAIVLPAVSHAQIPDSTISVSIVTDEAEAVLSILAKRAAGQQIDSADWRRLFATEGYMRLKKREESMRRKFTEDEFTSFLMSDTLAARLHQYTETLARWKNADVHGAARKALAYLPAGTKIRAKIYPVIKPKSNSFVFETSTDPAIFLFINPNVSREKFENTLAHELHHIGFAGAAAIHNVSKDTMRSAEVQTVLDWASAFGEGTAMLAAAGGPLVHPHAVSQPEERARWDEDMTRCATDMKQVEDFFFGILDRRFSEEEIRTRGMAFFGIQGPWYTVGWKMASTIELTYGRARLIECIPDPAAFLSTYNSAAEVQNRRTPGALPVWSQQLIEKLNVQK